MSSHENGLQCKDSANEECAALGLAVGGVSVEVTVLSDLSFPDPISQKIRFNQRGHLDHGTSC